MKKKEKSKKPKIVKNQKGRVHSKVHDCGDRSLPGSSITEFADKITCKKCLKIVIPPR